MWYPVQPCITITLYHPFKIAQNDNTTIIIMQKHLPKLQIPINHKITGIRVQKNYLICSTQQNIIVLHAITKDQFTIDFDTHSFKIGCFAPYVFICYTGQFVQMYPDQALIDREEIHAYKISKMSPRTLCAYNKGVLLGGYNRSFLPGDHLTKRRSIYYIDQLSSQHKNKSTWEIKLPESEEPVEQLFFQNPYIVAYMCPKIYIIHHSTKKILITVEKHTASFFLLEGRFATSDLNLIGISEPRSTLFSADVEKNPIFGVEVNEIDETVSAVCQSREGSIFIAQRNKIYSYDILHGSKSQFQQYPYNQMVVDLKCSLKNSLLVVTNIYGANKQIIVSSCIQSFNLL